VSAKLWAFHSKKFELALDTSINAWRAWFRFRLKKVPEKLDLKFYLILTLRMMVYLWASSDCEEEVLDPNVRSFLMNVLLHQRDAVPNSEVRTLKQQCKDHVINEWKSVIWEVQQQFFYYSEIEECLRWAREGSNIYGKKYADKVDYVSKFYEAATLFMAGGCEEVIKVCEEIREKLDPVDNQINDTNTYPAAQYCTVEYTCMIHEMLYICYWKIRFGPGQSAVRFEQLLKLSEECEALWSQIYADVKRLRRFKICLFKAAEHAENNKYDVDVYRLCPWLYVVVRVNISRFLDLC
jgi:hypothetical protein